MTDIDVYEDPIIRLTRDPDLNKEKEKTHELIRLINGFPPKERRVLKLCLSSFAILQSLEKMSLKLRNWEFMSLDINSNYHFKNEDDQIKDFNHNLADKVLEACKELNKKLNKIANDIDVITRASKTLTPLEFISDSGTMLTSLVLRNIKLKNEIVDALTVAYSKAKIIVIGRDLEAMLSDSNEQDEATILSYKTFIVSLLKQLNMALETDDNETKYECMAVVNDMEKIFDAFKLEKVKEAALSTYQNDSSLDEEEFDIRQYEDDSIPQEQYLMAKAAKDRHLSPPSTNTATPHMGHRKKNVSDSSSLTTPHSVMIDDDTDYDSDIGSNSFYSSSYTQPPLIHSITKAGDSKSVHRKDSFSLISNSSILQKTTISDELPYLMTAFNSAKNIEEDITHFKEKNVNNTTNQQPKTKRKVEEKKQESNKERHFAGHSAYLPQTSLYSESTILSRPPQSTLASSYLYSNNSLLSKLGIKPQVISTEMSQRELNDSTRSNQLTVSKERIYSIKDYKDEEESNKENNPITALTRANLESHTFSSLSTEAAFNDYVE